GWRVIREIVDQRLFWWSDLLDSLEDALPPEARIVSLSPSVKEGQYTIDFTAKLETNDARLGFVRTLEDRPEFEDVYPKSCTENQGLIECSYTMRYLGPDGRAQPLRPVK